MDILTKNLQALCVYLIDLAKALHDLEQEDFEYVARRSEGLDLNVRDNTKNCLLYDDPLACLRENLNELYPKYSLYPVLFYYGLGNGHLLNKLLKEPNHRLIILYEPNLSLIKLVLKTFDFSEAIASGRLFIFHSLSVDELITEKIFHLENNLNILNIYTLFIHSNYYEKYFGEDLQRINKLNLNRIGFRATAFGTSTSDALEG